MPILMPSDEMQTMNIPGPTGFKFSGTRPENLGADGFTLVTAACDISSSVRPFANDLSKSVASIVEACKKSPRAENLLFRLIVFNQNVNEIHGFIELGKIDQKEYKNILKPEGWTALFDATYNAIGSTLEYARTLIQQDFSCNGAVYIITDGMDNRSKTTPSMIAEIQKKASGNEEIESLVSALISLHDPALHFEKEAREALDLFHKKAEISGYVDVGEATPQKLAKLAEWVSQSISSQSQVLGTGTKSQLLNF